MSRAWTFLLTLLIIVMIMLVPIAAQAATFATGDTSGGSPWILLVLVGAILPALTIFYARSRHKNRSPGAALLSGDTFVNDIRYVGNDNGSRTRAARTTTAPARTGPYGN